MEELLSGVGPGGIGGTIKVEDVWDYFEMTPEERWKTMPLFGTWAPLRLSGLLVIPMEPSTPAEVGDLTVELSWAAIAKLTGMRELQGGIEYDADEE